MGALDLMMAAAGGEEKLYVDDVFSTYLYTGNGGSQTINNGIDLAGNGGLVWTKSRSTSASHLLIDTVRGVTQKLDCASTAAQVSDSTNQLYNVSSTGYRVANGDFGSSLSNISGTTYASWTFRRAPKFFDVVTYTGNGVENRQIPHSLGVVPGMIIIKRTDGIGSWIVYHQSLGFSNALQLETTSAGVGFGYVSATSSTAFTTGINTSAQTYVAYLFAHDPSAEGMIQCGSYVGNGGAQNINLGWEAQWVLVKPVEGPSSIGDWHIFDSMRGLAMSPTGSVALRPNIASAEFAGYTSCQPHASGFTITADNTGFNASGTTYIYLAIRRPNKPPKTGTEVYNAIARTGTGAAATVTGVGFAPDLVLSRRKDIDAGYPYNQHGWHDSLRGRARLLKSNVLATEAEVSESANEGFIGFSNDGVFLGADGNQTTINYSGFNYINHFFRRAPGFMDVVCYTGTGVARTVPHNLGVAPELMIVKSRSVAHNWPVLSKSLASYNYALTLNFNYSSEYHPAYWNNTAPTASVFSVGTDADTNEASTTYVAYLFATLPGISKVGSYTGNGGSQTINCGFATGARFVLIKRTDAAGDWYVWDTARGIVAANDPHLSLNTTAAEVTTDDSIDPDASGFIVNQNSATNINVSGGQYIFWAIA